MSAFSEITCYLEEKHAEADKKRQQSRKEWNRKLNGGRSENVETGVKFGVG